MDYSLCEGAFLAVWVWKGLLSSTFVVVVVLDSTWLSSVSGHCGLNLHFWFVDTCKIKTVFSSPKNWIIAQMISKDWFALPHLKIFVSFYQWEDFQPNWKSKDFYVLEL